MQVALGTRTAETAAVYFEKTNNETIRKVLPQKAKTVEEAVADFHASQLPGASSFGRTILADGRYVGDIWCYGIGPDGTPSAMVSYCVFEPACWSRGIATRAMELFLPEITRRFQLKTVGLPAVYAVRGLCQPLSFRISNRWPYTCSSRTTSYA